MNRKERAAFIAIVALAMTSGGFAIGATVNTTSSDQVIYACITPINKNLVRVSTTPITCPKNTSPISWNMVGPKGDQGVPGAQGPKGDTGLQGPKGDTGSSTDPNLGQQDTSGNVWVVSSDGSKSYKMLPNSSLFVDGALWQYSSGKLAAHHWGGAFATIYSSTDCSGKPYVWNPYEGMTINSVLQVDVGDQKLGEHFAWNKNYKVVKADQSLDWARSVYTNERCFPVSNFGTYLTNKNSLLSYVNGLYPNNGKFINLTRCEAKAATGWDSNTQTTIYTGNLLAGKCAPEVRVDMNVLLFDSVWGSNTDSYFMRYQPYVGTLVVDLQEIPVPNLGELYQEVR